MAAQKQRKEAPDAMDATATDPRSVAVTVKRSFAAPAELVFDAWLDPDFLAKWMFDPALRNEEVLRIAMDRRVGGSFSFRVRRQAKEVEYIGKYVEIVRPRRLVFSWATAPDSPDPNIASRVTIEIVPRAKSCDLTLVHKLRPEWTHYAPIAEENWAKELGVLHALLDPGA